MPCYDSRDDDDRKLTKERLNVAARVACELAKHLAAAEDLALWLAPLSKEARDWIKEHNRLDEERKVRSKKQIAKRMK